MYSKTQKLFQDFEWEANKPGDKIDTNVEFEDLSREYQRLKNVQKQSQGQVTLQSKQFDDLVLKSETDFIPFIEEELKESNLTKAKELGDKMRDQGFVDTQSQFYEQRTVQRSVNDSFEQIEQRVYTDSDYFN